MKYDANSLPNDPEQLKIMLLELQDKLADKTSELEDKTAELARKDLEIQRLLEGFELAKRKQFGKSSEHIGFGGTFNEVEDVLDETDKALLAECEGEIEVKAKQKPKRKPLPD